MIIGSDTIPFVGHDIEVRGINMYQKRIESTIDVYKPTSPKELQPFMGADYYFKDHLHDHSAVEKPLYDMVALATKQKTKALSWTTEGYVAFEKLKAFVNRLSFIDYQLPIVLYTYASDTTRTAHTYVNYVV